MMLNCKFSLNYAIAAVLFLCGCSQPLASTPLPTPPPATPSFASPIPTAVQYQRLQTATADLHLLRIPPTYTVRPLVASTMALLPDFVSSAAPIQSSQNGAQKPIALINGGFFDPSNQQSTSFVWQNGQLIADPRQNERLTQNPALLPYLDRIFNRSELRRYRCSLAQSSVAATDSTFRYDIVRRQDPSPPNCKLLDALGAGPQLLPSDTRVDEAFFASRADQVIRDPLGVNQPNARSAIALLPHGSLLFVMAAQRPDQPNSGLTLDQLTQVLKTQGAIKALNLDGGSSSSFWYQGQVYYGKWKADTGWVKRPVYSVLAVY